MNMKGTKRKKSSSEPDNIKRWRSEMSVYTGEEERPQKPKKKELKQLTRKEKRREGRKLKKMRQDAFRKHTAMPTHESLEGERKDKIKVIEKLRVRKEKRKRNRANKKARHEAEKKEEEEKQNQYDEESAADDKVIKQLEKQMKMNKRKSKTLPQSFQNDGLDFILNVLDSDNLKGVLDDEDEDLTSPLLDEDSEDSGDEEDFDVGDEALEDSELEDSDTEHPVPDVTGTPTEDVKGILKKSDTTDSTEKKVQFGEEIAVESSEKVPKKKADILAFIKKSIQEVKGAKQKTKKLKGKKQVGVGNEEEESDPEDEEQDSDGSESGEVDEEDSDEEIADEKADVIEEPQKRKQKKKLIGDGSEEEESDPEDENQDSDGSESEEVDEEDSDEEILDEEEDDNEEPQKRKQKKKPVQDKDSEDAETEDENNSNAEDSDEDEGSSSDDEDDEEAKIKGNSKNTKTQEQYKEDIYGRLLDKEGNVMSKKATGAYVPPGKRLQMASSQDEKKKIEIERMKKQLKGFINRLSESNLQSISSQVEDMFRTRSRADLSESLTAIIMEACVSPSLIPERLISEQMMLLAVLQGNVGNEVGAVFLQNLVEEFNRRYEQEDNPGKEMDNIIVMLANMYNFKMFQAVLIFDLLKKLTDSFRERDIELLLVLLKNVGFSLRKDDPAALKEVIVKVQEKAGSVNTATFKDESRVKFMLEVLMAIRNNNMRKIPNYDPSHVEHLRKVLRNYTKGTSSSDTQLRVSLDDLLNADARGRWWLVGSAWSGREAAQDQLEAQTESTLTNQYSEKILELARQQRMNTDIRRNIFCILLTSEDFADAFEKLLRLNLKNQQEREIIHVIIDVSLQEKSPNPFYAYLVQKFCEFHRRFQMTVQFNFWDRLKILSELTSSNMQNLIAFMAHLISTNAISISVFKVVEFSDLDKHKVALIRGVLRALLLDHADHVVTTVFSRVASFPKLATLREALRVFMTHFLLRRAKTPAEHTALNERIQLADRALGSGEGSMQL